MAKVSHLRYLSCFWLRMLAVSGQQQCTASSLSAAKSWDIVFKIVVFDVTRGDTFHIDLIKYARIFVFECARHCLRIYCLCLRNCQILRVIILLLRYVMRGSRVLQTFLILPGAWRPSAD